MILDSLALVIGGFVATAPEITRRKPGLHPAAQKLEPWHGAIGLTLLILGVTSTIRILMTLTRTNAVVFLVLLAAAMAQIGLGLLLGTPHLKVLPIPALQTQATNDKLERWRHTLQPYNTRLGFGAMVVGVLLLFI